MSKKDQIKINRLIHSIGLKYNLTDDEIRKIVQSPFEFTEQKLKELNEKINNAAELEELKDLKRVFLFKSLCKLYICEHRMESLLNRRKNIKKVNNDKRSK